MISNDENRKESHPFTGSRRVRLAGFVVLAVAICALVYSTYISPITLFGGAPTVSAQEGDGPDEEFMVPPTAAAVDMNATKIVVSGSAASPGEESGPFQILPILPERMDGKIYSGWISFTASAPIYVIPGYGFDAKNMTLNHAEFGELIRFPTEASFAGIPGVPPEATHGPIWPSYGPMPESGIGKLPSVYTATVPFAGELLEVGNVNGTKFLITYTVVADVYDTVRVSAMEPAILNTTETSENPVSITYGAVELTTDAYSPNPTIVGQGENVTWTNDDFLPHTVTSGTPEDIGTEFVGEEFDSGFIGTRSSFTHTFDQRGDYDYFCELHPNMVGTVNVR